MENTSKTYDVSYDGRLHTLYRMGFESARVDHPTSRTNIRNYWGDDWEFRHMDGSREVRTQNNGEGREMIRYLKRLWCALLNKKCSDTCTCNENG